MRQCALVQSSSPKSVQQNPEDSSELPEPPQAGKATTDYKKHGGAVVGRAGLISNEKMRNKYIDNCGTVLSFHDALYAP